MGNCVGMGASSGSGDSFVDVLFFPDRAMPCRNFRSAKGCTRKNCKALHDEQSSLLSLLAFLGDAKQTMDVCVFTITCDEVMAHKCFLLSIYLRYSV
jgi:cardiolipin hydrolase